MGVSDSISRLKDYYSRHGFGATLRRAVLTARRALFSSHMVLFYCDLADQISRPPDLFASMKVERIGSYVQVSPQDLQQMTSFWSPKQAHRNIKERFAKGATLWLIKSEDDLAGYGWTLQGHTIEPHYFPLGQDDVHLFDFHVFRQYRGRGINPLLVTHILRNLATNCMGRAFIEAAEWNNAQLASLQKTPFRRLGLARSLTIFGRTFVWWSRKESPEQLQKGGEQRDRPLTMARPHER
jgi:GNAT superfamily N-acetyltransferase